MKSFIYYASFIGLSFVLGSAGIFYDTWQFWASFVCVAIACLTVN